MLMVNTINYHLKEIFKSEEIQADATIRKFRIVQQEGAREAQSHANSEFEKYRIVQDKLFESDIDKIIKQIDSKK